MAIPLLACRLVASNLFTISGSVTEGDQTTNLNQSSSSLTGVYEEYQGTLIFANDEDSTLYTRSPHANIYWFQDDIVEGNPFFTITATAADTLVTAGPVRPGVIEYQLFTSHSTSMAGSPDSYYTNITGYSEVGISDGLHTYTQMDCPDINCQSAFLFAPFELGTTFSTYSLATEGGPSSVPSIVANQSGVIFNLFEADGTTPVPILETPDGTASIPIAFSPEPGTLAICGVGFTVGAAVLWWRRRVSLRDISSCETLSS